MLLCPQGFFSHSHPNRDLENSFNRSCGNWDTVVTNNVYHFLTSEEENKTEKLNKDTLLPCQNIDLYI